MLTSLIQSSKQTQKKNWFATFEEKPMQERNEHSFEFLPLMYHASEKWLFVMWLESTNDS